MISEVEVIFSDLILRFEEGGDGRTLSGMIAPWNTPTPVLRPVPGLESFTRGAFDKSLSESKRPIPLLLHHNEEEPAAKLVSHDSRPDGQYAVFRMLKTRAGDDAIELVREGILLGLSVGGFAVPARTAIKRLAGGQQHVVRSEMVLDHVGLVRVPAYEDAKVLALRSLDLGEYDPVAAAKARQRLRKRLREVA